MNEGDRAIVFCMMVTFDNVPVLPIFIDALGDNACPKHPRFSFSIELSNALPDILGENVHCSFSTVCSRPIYTVRFLSSINKHDSSSKKAGLIPAGSNGS